MELVFWASVVFVAYAYLGYPFVLALVALLRPKHIAKADVTPRVSHIITAHNEEKRLRAKIENAVAQEYPTGLLETLVASDCSTDRTDDIARGFESHGVRLVRAPERRGKEHAQRLAIAAAAGEILVFSDVGTALAADGVRSIVRNFADPTVGCVSSVDRLMDRDGRISGEGAYVRYEMLLRRLETRASTVVGLSGSFFAARRALCDSWSTDVPSDFQMLLSTVRMGYRGVSDPDSIGYYPPIADESRERQRKIRTVVRGIAALMANRDLLDPRGHPFVALQLWSHKICRWLVPFAMLLAFVANALLIRQRTYLVLFVLQLCFYAAACVGILSTGRLVRSRLFRLAAFFVLANLSIVSAWYRYAVGQRVISWTPSDR